MDGFSPRPNGGRIEPVTTWVKSEGPTEPTGHNRVADGTVPDSFPSHREPRAVNGTEGAAESVGVGMDRSRKPLNNNELKDEGGAPPATPERAPGELGLAW